MTVTLYPNTDLVAVEWLRGVANVDSSSVGTSLPTDNSSWAASGFLEVSTVGGTPNRDLPLAQPVVRIDAWASNASSKRPPWGKANNLIEAVRAATYDEATIQRALDLPQGYPTTRVLSAYLVSEPRRIEDDPSAYARYTADMQLYWVAIPQYSPYSDTYGGGY